MKVDYNKIVLSKGCVCYNTNNFSKCIVLDGNFGTANDRCSMVLELFSNGLRVHTPPNRALTPTGEYFDVTALENFLTVTPDVFREGAEC